MAKKRTKTTRRAKTKTRNKPSKHKAVKRRTVKRKAPKRKTTKKRSVRRASSRSYETHHSVLREALSDIAKELRQLREEKADLESTLDGVAGDITTTQNTEVDLKDQLRKLSSVENSLSLKRNRVRKKLESVKTKISKVRQLSNQMENI